jgi:YD repeat-containing protein
MSAGSVFPQGTVSNCSRSPIFSHLICSLATLLALFFFTSIVSAYECSERLGLFDKTGIEVPASGLGPNFTQTWPLKNNTSCPINNFTIANPEVWLWTGTGLAPYSGSVSGSYSTFSLAPNGGTGSVTANFTFTLPPEGAYTIFFDIITDDGKVLEYSMNNPPGYGRLWTVVGVDIAACLAPAHTINYVDHANLGYDNVAVNAEVENTIEDPTLTVDGNESTMESGSGDEYNSGNDTDSEGESENEVEAVGDCGLIAYLDYLYYSNYSAHLGVAHKMGQCPPLAGCQSFVGDPVNTAIGNFIQQETDAKVAGPGDSTINLSRTYNSQALLYTPASLRRYYPDGSYEVMAEPPQYFGKGWASELGQYLLEIDMAPTFDGVQLLYADGHTANFKKSGDQYISASPGTHDVITKEGDEYVLRDTDCQCALEEKRFNKDGYLTALVDRNGNRISLIYNGDKLTALKNAAGRQVNFELNSEGRITKAHLPENITLTYEYTDDLLTAFIDGRGGRTEYRYDDFGQMTEIISPNGYSIVRNTYDEQYRVSEQIVKENERYSFTYEKGKTTVSDSYGNATVHHYDDDLRLVRTDHPDGTAENYTFDEDLNRTKYIDQAGTEWSWTYDDKGNRLTEAGPLGWYQAWGYNERNQVTLMTEQVDPATQRTTVYKYDSKGNVTEFCLPLGACGNITYNGKGQPLNMTDLNGNTTINTYDSEGDLMSVTNPEGAVTSFNHDGLGRIVSKTKPLGNSYGYTYDPNSNLIAVDGPLGFHLGYSYDANDNLIQSVDPNGGISNYTYTESDSIQAVYNQLNFATSFGYGLMNERVALTDPEGREWEYRYNDMLRVTDVNGPLGYHQGFIYNALGMITDAIDPEGRVKHIEYDALKRPLTITRNYVAGGVENSDTNVSTSFTYNLIGDRLSVTDPEGYVFIAEYDLQSRLLKKQDAEGYEWEYSYDPMGNLLEQLNPNNFTTSYAYTPTNRLQSVTNPEQHIKSFTYNPNGSLISATDPKGTVSEYAYDELDRRIAQVRNSNLSAPADHETNVTTVFAYDLAGNLRFVTNPLDYRKEIRYDAAHRKVELIDYEEGSTTFTYDKVNNLLKVTDAEGHSTDYAVDDLNHLIAVTNAEKETTRYTYDVVGNRTQRIEADNTVTLYELDGVYRLNRVQENYRPDRDPGNDVNVLTT